MRVGENRLTCVTDSDETVILFPQTEQGPQTHKYGADTDQSCLYTRLSHSCGRTGLGTAGEVVCRIKRRCTTQPNGTEELVRSFGAATKRSSRAPSRAWRIHNNDSFRWACTRTRSPAQIGVHNHKRSKTSLLAIPRLGASDLTRSGQ